MTILEYKCSDYVECLDLGIISCVYIADSNAVNSNCDGILWKWWIININNPYQSAAFP